MPSWPSLLSTFRLPELRRASRNVDSVRSVMTFLAAQLALDVGPVAHGGHWVARAPDGRVVFVRHALTGERVLAEVTEEHPGFLRADTVELLSAPSPHRVAPPCAYASACGGCDFQHVAAAHQRDLKAAVVREQLARLAGLPDYPVRVEPLPGGPLGWRSRVRYAVDATGRPGLLAHRSHQVVPVDRCLIAHPAVQDLPVTSRTWPDADEVSVVASTGGDVAVVDEGTTVREHAVGREWTLPAGAFWQVHPAAPDTFAGVVLDLLDPRPGDHAWDLYGGAGLFAAALAPRVASVTLVESDPDAVRAARTSLADLANVHIVRSTVERFRWKARPDVVVLDPPRAGAGTRTARAIAAATRRAVVYVACDPAAFARDVGTFRSLGWELDALRAFDAFPMTHHVEVIGLLTAA